MSKERKLRNSSTRGAAKGKDMGKRTKAKVGGGKKGDDKKGKRDGGDKGGREDRILDTVSPPMSPNTRSARRFAETFLMSSPMSPNTRSRNAGGGRGSGSGKKGGSGDGKGSRSGGGKGRPDGGEEGGTGKEGGSGSGNKKALGSGSGGNKKALGSGSGKKKGGSGGLGAGADTTSGGAVGTRLFAEAMSAPVSTMSPNTRAHVAALGSADSGNKKALGSGSGKKGRSGGRGGADTTSGGGVGPHLFVQAMSAPVSSMSPNTRARVAALGSGSGKKKALGSGSGKKGRSGGRGGADATSGGGVGPRLFAKAMLAVSGMSPKTRAGEAAKLSPMSPNTRAHCDAAKTLLFPMVTNTAVLGEGSAGQKRHAVEDDPRESPRKRARQAKRPHKKVFDCDDEDDITHGNQVTKFNETFRLHNVIKESIFTHQKFANFDVDLKFSNKPDSICQRMAKKLGIGDDEVEDWWDCTRKPTHEYIKAHRNNTISGLRKLFQDKIVQQGTSNTNVEDEPHFLDVITHLRQSDNAKHYVQLMDTLIQAIVTCRVFKKNRTKNLFSEWVTVSDEAFLILCLVNYEKKWRYQKLQNLMGESPPPSSSDSDEDEETDDENFEDKKPKARNQDRKPRARYTGKDKGTKKSWSLSGLKAFNEAMIMVKRDRDSNGRHFDNLFLQMMKEKYDKPAAKSKHDKRGAVAMKEEHHILTDWNIQEFIEFDDKRRAEQGEARRGEKEHTSNSDSSEPSKHAV